MSEMTKLGGPAQWPVSRSGQKYAPMVRATRIRLEHILQNRLIMEGRPRGTEIRVEIHTHAWEITKIRSGHGPNPTINTARLTSLHQDRKHGP